MYIVYNNVYSIMHKICFSMSNYKAMQPIFWLVKSLF